MKYKILIVDDNDDIRYTIKASLNSLSKDYTFLEAESGPDCLNMLKKKIPQLILMDIMMPEMGGIETVKKIRENRDYDDIKILYLTAKTDKSSQKKGLSTADGFIEKPFVPEELDHKIKEVLNS